MYDDYVRDFRIIEKSDEEKKIELIVSIIRAKQELETANRNFEYAEAELIDYYTYQIKANRSKLDYLMKVAKKNGIVLDMIKELELRLNKAI